MPRIAKADVNNALQLAANSIIKAGGSDGRTSRAEMKKALATLPPAQRNLADIFFKFVDNRDFKAGAQVTAKDVKAAVSYAKEHMVAKYDLNNNGLSADEIKKMSLTGKRAVELAKALKAAPQPATLSGAALGKEIGIAAKDADYMSESDSTPAFVTGKPLNSSGVTVDNLKAAFGKQLPAVFEGDDDVHTLADMAFEISTPAETAAFLKDEMSMDEDSDPGHKSGAAWGKLQTVLNDNLTDVRLVKVGPAENGKLATDRGLYNYMLVGKAADGQLSGVQFTSVET
jgi:hypothetical protein